MGTGSGNFRGRCPDSIGPLPCRYRAPLRMLCGGDGGPAKVRLEAQQLIQVHDAAVVNWPVGAEKPKTLVVVAMTRPRTAK